MKSFRSETVVVDGCLNIYQGEVAETGVTIGFQSCNDSIQQAKRVVRSARSGGMRVIGQQVKDITPESPYSMVLYCQRHPKILGEPTVVRLWAEAGIGILGLAWHRTDQNQDDLERLGGSDDQFRGLTRLGRSVIRQCEEHGIHVDVSHCNRRTVIQACRASRRPVLCTHANAWKVCRSQRNKTDQELRVIAGTGGVIGITPIPDMLRSKFLVGDDLVDDFVAHVNHVVDLVGIDHVGLATDSYASGWGVGHRRYPGITLGHEHRWPNLAEILLKQGWLDDNIKKLLGGNFLRVLLAS